MKELKLKCDKPGLVKRKFCTSCKRILPVSEFNYSSSSKDHLQSWCRLCHKLYDVKKDTHGEERINFEEPVKDNVLCRYTAQELISELKRRGYDIDV